MKPLELKEKTSEELKKLKKEWCEELFHLRMKSTLGQLDKNHRMKQVRRDIARVLTLEQEKSMQN